MNTERVPEKLSSNLLAWSAPDSKGVRMARTAVDGEFYFVQEDLDSVWGGLICDKHAHSREFERVLDATQACENDHFDRVACKLGPSRFWIGWRG